MKSTIIVAILAAILGRPCIAAAQDAGYALQFDGASDFVKLSATDAIVGPSWPGTKTISLWVKPTGIATCTGVDPGACDVIFGDRPRTWGISRGAIGGQDRIWIWNYDGTFDRIGIEYTPGEWVQVALVHGAGLLTAYKNGVAVGSVASGNSQQITGQVLYFGGIIANTYRNWTFQGEIDELQIWRLARTPSEIAEDAARSLSGAEAGLGAYYRMSDGAGGLLTDNSGNGWSGTLNDGGSGVPPDGPIAWVPSGALGGIVLPPNNPPDAFDQTLATSEDVPLDLTLAGSDPDGDGLVFRIAAAPVHGTLSGTLPAVTYTPVPDYYGPDSFTFVANDGRTDSAVATVTLTVTAVNDWPIAVNDAAITSQDQSVTVAVLANDTDPDGDPLSLSLETSPADGIAIVGMDAISYTPNAGFNGTDTFTYRIMDASGFSATATVTITVRPPGPDPGYALRFDGTSDFVTLARTAYLFPPGWERTKTVSLWVRPTGSSFCNAPSPASCDAIFGDRPRWWGISRGAINGVDRIWIWNWDGNYNMVGIEYTPGEWIHIAMVHGGGVLSAYKNGSLVGSVPSGPTQQPNTGALPVLHVGGIINTSTRNWTFEGEIDEVQIWSKAHSGEDIANDMNRLLSSDEDGLAAYYRMSEGAGSFVADDSGHGWIGELQDGAPSRGVPADGPITWVPSGAFSSPPR